MTKRRSKNAGLGARAVPAYVTQRDIAWRNLMVAAINAGLEQGVFKLDPNADPWAQQEHRRYTFRTQFRRVVVDAREAGFDELSIHIMVEPSDAGERLLGAWPVTTRHDYCTAAAHGWFERRLGAWLQRAGGSPRLRTKRWQLEELVELRVEPLGYQDRGRFMM